MSMREYTRILYNRSLHRTFGNSGIGSVAVFMTFLFLLRSAVNLYFVFEFSSGKADMNLSQISAGWFIYIALYIMLCSSLSAFHVSFALPSFCFIDLSEKGKVFRRNFLARAAILRPANILILALIVTAFFIFSSVTTDYFIIFRGIILIAASIALSAAAFRIAGLIYPGKLEIQVLETGFLLLFIIINPDLFPKQGVVVLLFQGVFLQLDSFLTSAIILASLFCGQIILLLLLKFVSELNKRLKSGFASRPLIAWYLRFYNLNFWLLLYILIIPVVSAPVFDASIKTRALVVYFIFSALAFLIFINHCDNFLNESWQKKLLAKSNIKIILSPAMIHLLLTILPMCLIVFL